MPRAGETPTRHSFLPLTRAPCPPSRTCRDLLPAFHLDSEAPIDLRSMPPAVAEVYVLTVVRPRGRWAARPACLPARAARAPSAALQALAAPGHAATPPAPPPCPLLPAGGGAAAAGGREAHADRLPHHAARAAIRPLHGLVPLGQPQGRGAPQARGRQGRRGDAQAAHQVRAS